MKFRILSVLFALSLLFWSCDEPLPYDNSDFIYNPFAFSQDTLNTFTDISAGDSEVEWAHHLRAWVGETKYYKSGFTLDFTFSDSSVVIGQADSIQIHFRHQMTFPENGADTLSDTYQSFDFYNTLGSPIDINSGYYGTLLGSDTMNVSGGNNYWSYTLPDSTLIDGDTTISLAILPGSAGSLSALYGGGSTIRPSLTFYYHEADSAGDDSVTTIPFLADSLYMSLMKKTEAFDPQYAYLSQLSNDSLIFSLNLVDLEPGDDTLLHVISAQFLPAISNDSSALYISTLTDSLRKYSLTVTDPESEITLGITLGANEEYIENEIKAIIQAALDDGRTTVDLIVRSNHIGYDPGFVAISMVASESAIFVNSSVAVRP